MPTIPTADRAALRKGAIELRQEVRRVGVASGSLALDWLTVVIDLIGKLDAQDVVVAKLRENDMTLEHRHHCPALQAWDVAGACNCDGPVSAFDQIMEHRAEIERLEGVVGQAIEERDRAKEALAKACVKGQD